MTPAEFSSLWVGASVRHADAAELRGRAVVGLGMPESGWSVFWRAYPAAHGRAPTGRRPGLGRSAAAL